MRVLAALPVEHPIFNSIDGILEGALAASGTNGSLIRLDPTIPTRCFTYPFLLRPGNSWTELCLDVSDAGTSGTLS